MYTQGTYTVKDAKDVPEKEGNLDVTDLDIDKADKGKLIYVPVGMFEPSILSGSQKKALGYAPPRSPTRPAHLPAPLTSLAALVTHVHRFVMKVESVKKGTFTLLADDECYSDFTIKQLKAGGAIVLSKQE